MVVIYWKREGRREREREKERERERERERVVDVFNFRATFSGKSIHPVQLNARPQQRTDGFIDMAAFI